MQKVFALMSVLVLASLWSCASAPSPVLLETLQKREQAAQSAEQKAKDLQAERQVLQADLTLTEARTMRLQAVLDSLQGGGE